MASDISSRADLEAARDALVYGIGVVTNGGDLARLPALVRELRETWKALGLDESEGDGEDEFTRARRERSDRAAGS